MAFKREIKTQYISESDNIWDDNPFWKQNCGIDKKQVIGTRVTVTVIDEASGLLRTMSVVLEPQYAIEDKDSKELIEQCYLTCEQHLERDLKKRANEFRAQNIV